MVMRMNLQGMVKDITVVEYTKCAKLFRGRKLCQLVMGKEVELIWRYVIAMATLRHVASTFPSHLNKIARGCASDRCVDHPTFGPRPASTGKLAFERVIRLSMYQRAARFES
jgi:hypothetical protein